MARPVSALRAATVFLAGLLAGANLTWYLTHDHCKWSPWDCIHVSHHVLFVGVYVVVAVMVWKGGDTE